MNGRTCEHDSGCDAPPYSWSQEHGNDVLCKVHYKEFLKNRGKIRAKGILAELSKEDLKQVLKELTQ